MRTLLAKVLPIYPSEKFFHDISAIPLGHSIIINPHFLAFCSDLCHDPVGMYFTTFGFFGNMISTANG